MNRSWYPFYVGDYIRETAHLSMLEHGAYRLLIDHYMGTGHPIPKDTHKIYRICRATTRIERQIVLQIVCEFFVLQGDYYHNKRCDEEILKQLNYSNSQSAKAKIRHNLGISSADAKNQPASALPQSQPHLDTNSEGKEPSSSVSPERRKIDFDWSTGKFTGITQRFVLMWTESYPALDIAAQIRKMQSWQVSNPKLKKKDYLRFINSWLSKEQDRAGSRTINQPTFQSFEEKAKSKTDAAIEEARKRYDSKPS